MTLIETTTDPVEMSYLKAMLTAEGLDVVVQVPVRGSLYRIFVGEGQAETASKLIESLRKDL